jgi:hypothetical protein
MGSEGYLSKQGRQVVSGRRVFLPLRSRRAGDSLKILTTAP